MPSETGKSMRALLLLSLLVMPLTSCVPPPTTPRSTDVCHVPVLPPVPALAPGSAGDLVTLTVHEATELARWIVRVRDVEEALQGCPLVVRQFSDVEYTSAPVGDLVAARAADLETLADKVIPDGVTVDVVWRRCGQVNGYYSPGTITMCYEDLFDPEFARFVFAHEVGHAVVDQMNVPVIGSEEVAADEYAAWCLAHADDRDAILAGVKFFLEHPRPEDPVDPHPSPARRAWTLLCLEDGSEDSPTVAQCAREWKRADRTWERMTHAE